MSRGSLVIFLALFAYCFGQLGIESVGQSICLYAGWPIQNTLKPLQLFNTDCPKNTSYCMNTVYNYRPDLFRYNGIAALKPALGEVVAFLTQDQQGLVDLVIILNTNIDVTSKVTVSITGAAPTNILLKDDPQNDSWQWDPTTNTGNFSWVTKPSYTDGVVIGHIQFIDNYCISSSFSQTAGAITLVSVLSGTTKNVTRVLSQPYVAGSSFQFCQYPLTTTYKKDATCPGASDGSASITINNGPTNVQYLWYDVTGTLIHNGQNLTNIPAGTYLGMVNDTSSAGCSANRQVIIGDHTLNGAIVSSTPFACTTKGTATATPDGGAGGFTYAWFTAGSSTAFATTSSVTGLNPGNYIVRITDSCGSVKDTPFVINSTICCGDGTCNGAETCDTCSQDCGVCCPAGTIISGSTCAPCPAGSRSTTTQSTSCTSCPANTFNAGGSDACAACPVNYFSTAGSGKCLRCPAGQVRATSDSACSACSAGSYAPACDDSACTACPAGSISASSGATFCTTCPAGTSAAAGKSSCTPCAVGSYSLAGAASCTPCPTGSTTAAIGAGTHLLACN